MQIRRINIWGGPGSGKSTMASGIFSMMKKANYNVDLSLEFIKDWTYIPRNSVTFDQITIFGNQLEREHVRLKSGVDLIVTDSPSLLNCYYAAHVTKMPGWKNLVNLAEEYEKHYPSLNFFVKRVDERFAQIGRFQNLEESKKIDKELYAFFVNHTNGKPIYSYSCEDVDGVYNKIIEVLGQKDDGFNQLRLF